MTEAVPLNNIFFTLMYGVPAGCKSYGRDAQRSRFSTRRYFTTERGLCRSPRANASVKNLKILCYAIIHFRKNKNKDI